MSFASFFKSKWFTALLMAVVAIVYVSQISNVFDRKIDVNGDNIYYFTLAQALSSGQGYSSIIGYDAASPHMHFPPGYSAFLSIFMRLGIDSVIQVKIINCILLLLGILLLFLILRKVGCKPLFAAMVCLLVSSHAEILRWASMMMSEQLFLVVNLLIIYLLCCLDLNDIFRKGAWKTWLQMFFIGLLAGYSYLVRSMGLSMALALVIWFGIIIYRLFFSGLKEKSVNYRKIAGYAVALAVLVLCVLAVRSAWSARNQKVSPGFKSDYLGDFKKKEGGQTMDGFADWQQRASNNLKSYVTYYIPDALFEKDKATDKPSALSWTGGVLIVLLVTAGLLSLSEAGLALFLYVLVTFIVLMIWPEQYAGLRYFLTLIPILIAGFCRGLYLVCMWPVRKLAGKDMEFVSLIPVLVLLFVVLPRYHKAQEYYHETAKIRSWKNVRDPGIRNYALASEWAGKNLPKDARLICRKPELFYMLSGYHHAGGFPQYATPEEVMELIDSSRVEYIILDVMYIHAYKTLYPAIDKYKDRFRFIQVWRDDEKSIPTLMVQVVR